MDSLLLDKLFNKKVLLSGASGMLGGEIGRDLLDKKCKVYFCSLNGGKKIRGEKIFPLDIRDEKSVIKKIEEISPSWIINSSAYTDVDGAEKNKEQANRVNIEGAKNLAKGALRVDAKMVQISSDYVFSNLEGVNKPLSEEDKVSAKGAYAISKLEGEKVVSDLLQGRSIILRTSWLHGIRGKNFLDTMLNIGPKLKKLKVVNDQIGSPTWAPWLSKVILKLISKEARGIYHASSIGEISWYEFSKEIFKQANLENEVLVEPQSTLESNRLAPRPSYSVLSNKKLEKFLNEPSIFWKDCIREHLKARCLKDRSKS